MMDAKILAQLVRLNDTLDAMRHEQQEFTGALRTTLERIYDAVGAVESAVSITHGSLDQAAESLFELQMYLTPGGDPREPMPTNSD